MTWDDYIDFVKARVAVGVLFTIMVVAALLVGCAAGGAAAWWRTRQLLKAERHWTQVREKIDREAK